MGGGRHCFSRSVGLFAALGLLVAQSALAFETDLFSVNFPETPQVFHLPIDTVVADSYQAEELDPPVSYVVTVAPFVELVQDVSLRSFLDNEIDAANGTLKTATAFQYEGLEAIAFDARINFEGSWVFRKGVVLRAPDHLIFILAQTPEPVAKQFPKMAAENSTGHCNTSASLSAGELKSSVFLGL